MATANNFSVARNFVFPVAMHNRRNVGGGRVYYITAHIVHPASAAHTAVVVFPCLFAR